MKKLLVTTLLLAFVAVALFAVPAKPGFRVFEQPDGTKFIAELKGDEHFHFAQTEDGNAIVRNSEGWWTFANKVDGLLVPSMFIAGKDECPFGKGLRPDADKVASLPGNEMKQINWSKMIDINDEAAKDGYADRKFLVILGCFDDSSFLGTVKPANWNINPWTLRSGFTSGKNGGTAHDSLYWDSVFFSYSAGSFRTFFKEISFGRWTIDTMCHVQGPVSVGGSGTTRNYYQYGDGAELTYMQNIAYASSGRMKYGTTRRTDQNAYSDYDGDGDGYVDHWLVVRAGGEQSATGSTKDMWATKYTTTISTTTGATIRNPTNAGELQDSLSKNWTLTQLLDTLFIRSFTMGIGVHAHESYHAFTAPDLYDYGYQGEPADMWSLMDGGSWNGDGVQSGSRPPHPGAMLQYAFAGAPETGDATSGFMPDDWDQLITTNGRYAVVGLAADSVKGGPRFMMIRNAAMTTAGEYFFVENRNNKGFFESVFPEHGLIIVHYDQSEKGSYYNEGQYYTYWVEQRGFDPAIHDTYTADTIYRDAGQAPYFAGDDYEFTNLTSAGANVNGSTTNFGPYIIGISKPGDTMWFTVDNATVPATASFAYKSNIVYDTIVNYGNNNGCAEPDELVDLKVTIKNVGAAATGITAKLRSTQSLVIITDSTAAYPNIASLASAANSDNFRVKIKSGTPSDTILFFTLAVTSGAGSNVTEFGIKINSTPMDTSFFLRTKSTALTDAAALDIHWLGDWGIDDWAIVAAGSALGNVYGTGSKQIWFWTLSDNGATLQDYFSYTSANYAQCMDHDAAGYTWISCGDSALRYDLTTQTQLSRTRWSNTDYAGTIMKRVRGVTFDNNDSLFGYWQTYGTFEESLLGQRKVLNGLATRFWGVPLLDGTSYGGKWNNGRGIEWDGTCFWSVNIFENLIFRKTPYTAGFPSSDPTAFKTINTISCPSVQGNYPAYDIAFQGISSDGLTPAVPFGKNNKYYLWTLNMDNSEVTKIDVTSLVLPKAVAGLTISRVPTSTTVNLSWTANAASDFVTKYVVYRSTTPNFYAKDTDSVATTTGTSLVNIVPAAKTDYYYKVKAVNYQGYSLTPSEEKIASGAVATMEISLMASQVNNDINLEWAAQTTAGKSWEITRTSEKETEVIGTVDIKSSKFVDSNLPGNGTYTYTLSRVDVDGNKVAMGETKVKFFSTLVFGIAPLKQNPVKNSFTLYYSIDRNEPVTLNVYSITGQVVMSLADGVMAPGFYSARIDAEKLSSGVYFAVLKQGNKEAKERITFLK